MSSNTLQSDIIEEMCDLSDFKAKFNKQVIDFFESQCGNVKKPWTRDRILEVKEHVKQGRTAIAGGLRRTPMQYYWCAKYDILQEDNEEYLIVKKSKKSDRYIRIVAIEDYFEILLAAHAETGHGGRDKLTKMVKKNYYIQRRPMEIFLMLCPTCEVKRTIPRNSITKPIVSKDLNSRGQVDIISYVMATDGPYKYLLCYQDDVTKFVQLRPIMTDQPPEIAMELVKIFATFGAPCVLQSDKSQKFTADIVKEVLKVWPECKLVHGGSKQPEASEQTVQDVKDMLSIWMHENSSNKWSLGCYVVQYHKNELFNKGIGRSPYRALFGCEPKIGLQSLNIPEDTMKSIDSEEDLEHFQLSEASSAFESINTAEVPLISDTDDTVSAPPVKSPVVPERHVCVSCEKSFDGFVYECVQCEYRMCSKCDQEGVHSEHYVLRIPADRSKEEVIMVLEKVRQAIEPLELHPPARAKRKRKKIPQTSQSETESDSDDDVAAEPTVEVKLEVESDEDDPLSSLVKPESSDDVTRPTPCTLVRRMPVNTVNQTESHIDLEILPETIKMEPPDEGCPSTSFSAQTTTRAPRHPKMTPAAAQTVPSAHQTVPSDHQTDLTDYQTASGPVKRLAPNLSRGSVMAKKGRPKIFQLDT